MKSRAVKLFCVGAVLTVVSFAASDEPQTAEITGMRVARQVGRDDMKEDDIGRTINLSSEADIRRQFQQLHRAYYMTKIEHSNSFFMEQWSGIGGTNTVVEKTRHVQDRIGQMLETLRLPESNQYLVQMMNSIKQETQLVLTQAEQMSEEQMRAANYLLSSVDETLLAAIKTNGRRKQRLRSLSSIVTSALFQKKVQYSEKSSRNDVIVDMVILLITQFNNLDEELERRWDLQRGFRFRRKRGDNRLRHVVQIMDQLAEILHAMEGVCRKLDQQLSFLRGDTGRDEEDITSGIWSHFANRKEDNASTRSHAINELVLTPIFLEQKSYHETFTVREIQKDEMINPSGKQFGALLSKKWSEDDVRNLWNVKRRVDTAKSALRIEIKQRVREFVENNIPAGDAFQGHELPEEMIAEILEVGKAAGFDEDEIEQIWNRVIKAIRRQYDASDSSESD